MKIHQLQRIVINPQQKQGENIIFTPEQEHYLYRVLRLKEEDKIIVMNGQGQAWLVKLNHKINSIIEPFAQATELPINITLICALPKGNNFDDVVRSCTELGVNTIIPVISSRTILKPSSNKVERWRKIALEASEQSERQIVPTLLDPLPFTQLFNHLNFENSQAFICVARGEHPHLLSYLTPKTTQDIIITIGTEGGWTEEEIKMATDANFQVVSLGKRILRAVTAPMMALSLISSYAEV
jgi:16S rRNA (uracil1498-N3)-methyltransferase